jgi:rare lipoprotein A
MKLKKTRQKTQKAITVVFFLLFSLIISMISEGQTGTKFSGVASYYGVPFHGRATASGEIFSMDSMTAAHKQLAFGTLVRVTNRSNGKSCVVKINDRGPFIAGRMIDLSKAAADTLDFIAQGLITVDCEIIGTATINRPLLAAKTIKSDTPKETTVIKNESHADVKKESTDTKISKYIPREAVKYVTSSPDSFTFYSVQLGSFGMQQNAEALLKKVEGKFPDARMMQAEVYGKIWFRVLCGKYPTIDEATKLKNSLIKTYPQSFLVKFEHAEQNTETTE